MVHNKKIVIGYRSAMIYFTMIYEPSTMNQSNFLIFTPQNVLSLPTCLAEESPGNIEHPAS